MRRDLSWTDASGIELIGTGAWSTAFAFRSRGRDLVIRLGEHGGDFSRDESMSRLASTHLPIPAVLDRGTTPGSSAADSLHYCISVRAFGEPLEHCRERDWPAVAEQVADAMEAMRSRTADAEHRAESEGEQVSWRQQLLAIERVDLDPRMAGWHELLATSDRGAGAFERGMAALRVLDIGDVALTLVHGDLLNKNVHVHNGAISGIFDWGCQRWGDHLFDLAWFEFWSPWHPNLDVAVLRDALRSRWSAVGYAPDREDARMQASLVYIGLEHLIYNAVMRRPGELQAVIDRMTALDLI